MTEFPCGPGFVFFEARDMLWRLDFAASAARRVLRVNALSAALGDIRTDLCRAVTGLADWKLARGLDHLMRGLSRPGTSATQSDVFLASLADLLRESPAADIIVLRGALTAIRDIQDGTLEIYPLPTEPDGVPA